MTYRVRPLTSDEADGTLDRSDQERSEDTVDFETLESGTSERDENVSLGNFSFHSSVCFSSDYY